MSNPPRTARDWFDGLVDLPYEKQNQQLHALAQSDPSMVQVVRRLLAADLNDAPFPLAIEGIQARAALNPEAIDPADEMPTPPPLSDLVLSDPENLGQPSIPGFRFIRPIGEGGMGVVWLARQLGTNRLVAIKQLSPGLIGSKSAQERFRREVEAVASLSHPYIVPVLATGVHQAVFYFAMAYIPGTTLGERMSSSPLLESLRLFEKICQAVGHAHQRGLVHRDLKPGNIMVTPENNPCLLDFGLAKDGDSDHLTLTGQVVGTLAYLSPEQLEHGSHKIDVRSDVFSLGVLLHQMATGVLPFQRHWQQTHQGVGQETPPPIRVASREINRALELVCHKALAAEPNDRYRDANALAEDIHRLLKFENVKAKPIAPWRRWWSWACRPERAVQASWIIGAIVVMVGLLHMLAFVMFALRDDAGSDLDAVSSTHAWFYVFLAGATLGAVSSLKQVRLIAKFNMHALCFCFAGALLALLWNLGNLFNSITVFDTLELVNSAQKTSLFFVCVLINLFVLVVLLLASVSIRANKKRTLGFSVSSA